MGRNGRRVGSAWREHERHAAEALSRFPDRHDFVVASGGRVSGHWHAFSDLDLYALLSDAEAEEDELETRVDGVLVQLNELPQSLLTTLVVELGAHRLTRQDRRQVAAYLAHGKLASRLVTGVVLHASAQGYAVLAALSRTGLARTGLSVHGILTARMLEDAAGAVLRDEPLIAARAAVLALDHAFECALHALGDVHWGEALLWRRVEQHAPLGPAARAAAEALSLLAGGLHGPATLHSATALCRTASVVASVAAAGSIDRLARQDLLTPVTDSARAVPECDASTSREFEVAVSFADGIALLGPGRDVAAEPVAALDRLGLAPFARPLGHDEGA